MVDVTKQVSLYSEFGLFLSSAVILTVIHAELKPHYSFETVTQISAVRSNTS